MPQLRQGSGTECVGMPQTVGRPGTRQVCSVPAMRGGALPPAPHPGRPPQGWRAPHAQRKCCSPKACEGIQCDGEDQQRGKRLRREGAQKRLLGGKASPRDVVQVGQRSNPRSRRWIRRAAYEAAGEGRLAHGLHEGRCSILRNMAPVEKLAGRATLAALPSLLGPEDRGCLAEQEAMSPNLRSLRAVQNHIHGDERTRIVLSQRVRGTTRKRGASWASLRAEQGGVRLNSKA